MSKQLHAFHIMRTLFWKSTTYTYLYTTGLPQSTYTQLKVQLSAAPLAALTKALIKSF